MLTQAMKSFPLHVMLRPTGRNITRAWRRGSVERQTPPHDLFPSAFAARPPKQTEDNGVWGGVAASNPPSESPNTIQHEHTMLPQAKSCVLCKSECLKHA